YPRLDMSTPKIYPYIEAAEEHQPHSLPYALTQIGYHTVYLQAADLGFMSKDRFMPEVGFDEVLGSEHFDSQYVPFDWGPDDRAYFEQAADYIDTTLEEGDRPWFLTLLTVGTHHPYGVSEDFASEYPNRQAAAIAYLDAALEEFMARLEADGVLEDTAVFIVSDESHGFGGHPFGRYWGTTVVRVPETDEHVMQKGIFGLIDVPVSVLDYLGADSLAEGFPGRSMLREYDSPRTLHFGPFISHTASSGRHRVFERLNRNEFAEYSPVGDGLFVADYERSTGLFVPGAGAGEVEGNEPGAGEEVAAEDLIRHLEHSYERANAFGAGNMESGDEDSTTGQVRQRTSSLIEDADYTLAPGQERTLSNAQYLEFDAGSVFTIHLDMEVEGPVENGSSDENESPVESEGIGEVEGPLDAQDTAEESGESEILHPSLQMLSDYEAVDIALPEIPPMSVGETFEMEMSLPATRDLTRVWFDLRVYSSAEDREVTVRVRDFSLEVRDPLPTVAHAGGDYRGQSYTNSVEALKHNAENYRMFEIDVRRTSDGTLVGMHDWDSTFERLYGVEPDGPPSMSELGKVSEAARLTPVTLDTMQTFLSENPGVSMVVDVERDDIRALEQIAGNIPDYAQRIIPAVSDPDSFDDIERLGYEHGIWSLGQPSGQSPRRSSGQPSDMRDKDLIAERMRDFERQYPDTLFAVTIPADSGHEDIPEAIARLGVPVYAYTVDSCEQVRELVSRGVSSVYTNALGRECEAQ
ncbi:MAG: sulfatase-like hydrolase/transferase, partial [Spirochaetia bacterium]